MHVVEERSLIYRVSYRRVNNAHLGALKHMCMRTPTYMLLDAMLIGTNVEEIDHNSYEIETLMTGFSLWGNRGLFPDNAPQTGVWIMLI